MFELDPILIASLLALAFLLLGFTGAPLFAWGGIAVLGVFALGAPCWLLVALAVGTAIGVIRPLRALILTRAVMALFSRLKLFPKISETERAAIEAGTTWIEGELFSGRPDFHKILAQPYPKLTADEKSFLDGPCERLCATIDDWKIWKERRIPDEVWEMIKKEKFLGMIIPREYGGLGFSALAHSEVIRKLTTRSSAVTTVVMVPNSLGPAELLIHYGTDVQKKRLLPKLAVGEEIPCFALTEPLAGSDAGSLTADGVLFKDSSGKLKLKLNWDKRWITLASISTILGLAFRLKDPENLLGKGPDLGITCALIPSKTPGVVLGLRHDPLGMPFPNCPTQGKDVVVDAEEAIIGGVKNAGRGWTMLMESLAAGRGISFPAQSAGVSQMVTRVTSAHARLRQQFGVSIGKFEGIQHPLARIVGFDYLLESLRMCTLSALDQGLKPAVVTAISKYYSTELARRVVNDGMDILGGAGISLGPRNLLGHYYITAPIAITVEGANILTRTLMIFGQGALRAHPYAFAEVKALEAGDVKAFDLAFWSHIGHSVRNLFRSVLLSVTHGWLAPGPKRGSTGVYYRKLAWSSASFAILADLAMGSLGGKLKIKESQTGRFADVLGYMYLGSAVLMRFEADGARREDLPLVHFSMSFVLGEIQRAFDGILGNFEVPGLSWLFRGPLRSWSSVASLGGEVSDAHVTKIASIILNDATQREHLTRGIYLPKDPSEQLARLERGFVTLNRAEPVEKKIRDAVHSRKLPKASPSDLVARALELKIISSEDAAAWNAWESCRRDMIAVDAFTEDEYIG